MLCMSTSRMAACPAWGCWSSVGDVQ